MSAADPISASNNPDNVRQARLIRSILEGSHLVRTILVTLGRLDPALWLGAGVIRNLVWDHLHGFATPTPMADVDVIYFDETDAVRERDLELERKLRAEIPDLNWSVKNQARMHLHNGEAPYASLEDALSKWPETATAIAAHLDADGDLSLIAPFGFDDLLDLIVAPTPHFARRLEIVRDRVEAKGWLEKWPRLRIALPENPHRQR